LTRQRDGWFRGNYPLRADFTSHSSPSPAVSEKLKKALGKKKHKKKKKKKKES
jgi:hypothetical protein